MLWGIFSPFWVSFSWYALRLDCFSIPYLSEKIYLFLCQHSSYSSASSAYAQYNHALACRKAPVYTGQNQENQEVENSHQKPPQKFPALCFFSRHHSSGKCRQHVDRLDSNGDLPLIQIQFPQCQRQQRKKDSCHNPGQKHPFSCSKYSVFPCSCCFHIQSLPYITICASFENMNRTGLTFHPS